MLFRSGSRALIITGCHSSKENGSLNDLTNELEQAGHSYYIYDKIEENPSIECIMDAVKNSQTYNPDYIIGLGGGSPLDASKAIALLLKNNCNTSELLFAQPTTPLEHLPVICIPTTCGTGSEVTPYSILTIHKSKTKSSIPHMVFPSLALIDPMYLKSAPLKLLRNTAVDALGHCIESYINPRATAISNLYSEKGLISWTQIKNILTKSNLDYNDYEMLMLTSSYAGIAISHTGTSLPHGMSYSLTYHHNIEHGCAVGAFLASFIRHANETIRDNTLYLLGYSSCDELHKDITNLCGAITVTHRQYKEIGRAHV